MSLRARNRWVSWQRNSHVANCEDFQRECFKIFWRLPLMKKFVENLLESSSREVLDLVMKNIIRMFLSIFGLKKLKRI